mmetsp:Transcript_83347/g.222905  ORF Transcript_83347/g.222905 Transcript_83347/m.222905 type:complete len:337 (-) Transcript_83347:122-1132(-)
MVATSQGGIVEPLGSVVDRDEQGAYSHRVDDDPRRRPSSLDPLVLTPGSLGAVRGFPLRGLRRHGQALRVLSRRHTQLARKRVQKLNGVLVNGDPQGQHPQLQAQRGHGASRNGVGSGAEVSLVPKPLRKNLVVAGDQQHVQILRPRPGEVVLVVGQEIAVVAPAHRVLHDDVLEAAGGAAADGGHLVVLLQLHGAEEHVVDVEANRIRPRPSQHPRLGPGGQSLREDRGAAGVLLEVLPGVEAEADARDAHGDPHLLLHPLRRGKLRGLPRLGTIGEEVGDNLDILRVNEPSDMRGLLHFLQHRHAGVQGGRWIELIHRRGLVVGLVHAADIGHH